MSEANGVFHKPLTSKDVTSPAFIEKVVEILNGDNEKTEIVQATPANTNSMPNQPNQPIQAPFLPNQPFQAPFQQGSLGNPATNNQMPNQLNSPPPGIPPLNGVPKPQNIPMVPGMSAAGIFFILFSVLALRPLAVGSVFYLLITIDRLHVFFYSVLNF